MGLIEERGEKYGSIAESMDLIGKLWGATLLSHYREPTSVRVGLSYGIPGHVVAAMFGVMKLGVRAVAPYKFDPDHTDDRRCSPADLRVTGDGLEEIRRALRIPDQHQFFFGRQRHRGNGFPDLGGVLLDSG